VTAGTTTSVSQSSGQSYGDTGKIVPPSQQKLPSSGSNRRDAVYRERFADFVAVAASIVGEREAAPRGSSCRPRRWRAGRGRAS
jgi:hypothetical protein